MYYYISNLFKGLDYVKYVVRSRLLNKKWSEALSLIWWFKLGNETWFDFLDEVIVMMINLLYFFLLKSKNDKIFFLLINCRKFFLRNKVILK